MASPNDANKIDRLVRLVNAGIDINGTHVAIGSSVTGIIGATGATGPTGPAGPGIGTVSGINLSGTVTTSGNIALSGSVIFDGGNF